MQHSLRNFVWFSRDHWHVIQKQILSFLICCFVSVKYIYSFGYNAVFIWYHCYKNLLKTDQLTCKSSYKYIFLTWPLPSGSWTSFIYLNQGTLYFHYIHVGFRTRVQSPHNSEVGILSFKQRERPKLSLNSYQILKIGALYYVSQQKNILKNNLQKLAQFGYIIILHFPASLKYSKDSIFTQTFYNAIFSFQLS